MFQHRYNQLRFWFQHLQTHNFLSKQAFIFLQNKRKRTLIFFVFSFVILPVFVCSVRWLHFQSVCVCACVCARARATVYQTPDAETKNDSELLGPFKKHAASRGNTVRPPGKNLSSRFVLFLVRLWKI